MPESFPQLIEPPSNVLLDVFPLDVRDRWRQSGRPDLLRRLQFMTASGPAPSSPRMAMLLRHCRAVRAAWETYIFCAFDYGFFSGGRGKDLYSKLQGEDPEGFRSAMAECIACWFFAGRSGFPVDSVACGRKGKILDMQVLVEGTWVGVEVKAPHREVPEEAWHGHDGDILANRLREANKKFHRDRPNILVLVPQLRTPVSQLRVQLTSALYGQEVITQRIDTRTGTPIGETMTEFVQDGLLLRPDHRKMSRRHTRISAIIVIEESHACGHERCWGDHDILVAHNPYALHRLDPKVFSSHIQFMDLGDGYGWNDGEPLS